jgi:selenium metabolism protein YedF
VVQRRRDVAKDEDLLLILGSAGLGDGEPDLGEKLMRAFLSMLFESEKLPARIICMNSGVFLTTEGSPVLELLAKFEAEGCEILSCRTCLEYFERSEALRIGKPTTMRDTVASMLSFARVLTP